MKSLKTISMAFVLVMLFAGVLFAQDGKPSTEDKSIDFSASRSSILKAMDEIEKNSNTSRNDVVSLIHQCLNFLRGPKPDGSGYYYADVKMGKNNESVTLASESITAVWEMGQKKVITVDASTAYAFVISLPLHRGFFKNNGRIYIDSYTLDYSINGRKKTEKTDYRKWMEKDTEIDVALPGIAESARLEVVCGVAPSDVEKTLVEINAKYPLVDDDPMHPYSYSISRLKDAESRIVLGRKIKESLKLLDDALAGLDLIPQAFNCPKTANTTAQTPTPADSSSFASTPENKELVASLEKILYLLEGNKIEAQEGRDNLKELIKSVKKQ